MPIKTISLCMDDLASIINPYSPLESRIIAITQLTDQNKADLDQAFQLAHGRFWPAKRIQKLISSLPTDVIKQFLDDNLLKSQESDLDKILSKYFDFLPAEVLLKLSDFKDLEAAEAWHLSRALIKDFALQNFIEKESRALLGEFLIE